MLTYSTSQYSDNQRRLLQMISLGRDITRQDLVQMSGLSVLTVTRFVAGFIVDGLVRESGTVESKSGRKPAVLTINPEYASIIALDIGAANVRIGLVSIDGTLIDKQEIPFQAMKFPADILSPADLLAAIESFREKHADRKIIGIGLGISGLVDDQQGKIIFCPNITGYDNLPVKDLLLERFGLPVQINTSARCMALAEQRFGAGRGFANQVFVSLGISISAGIIIKSEIFSGANGFSGEIGHTFAGDLGMPCTCGNVDCLETHATLPEIMNRIKVRLSQSNVYSLAKSMAPSTDQIDVAIVNHALANGDKVIFAVLDEIGVEIGNVLANLANILNPETIILGGGVIECFPSLLEPITRALKQKVLITNQQKLIIQKSALGLDCGLIGSATQVINAVFE